jgi:hypothetical protein
MLILLHGSGDDDTKPENWMPTVAALMDFHGDLALTLPGVGSGDRSNLKRYAKTFIRRVKSKWERLGSPAAGRFTADPADSLTSALSAGDNLTTLRDFRGKLNFSQAEDFVDSLAQKDETGLLGMDQLGGNGIKLRAGVAAFCAIIYHGYIPEEHATPLRIVGHSRGGSAAISTHNLLSYWGMTPTTLTLDPCHGAKSARANKLHWHTVWTGTVYNIPVVKEVADMPKGSTKRPPITAHTDGDATVTNHSPKLPTIKHGHMGKLRSFSGSTKESGRAAMKASMDRFLMRAATEASSGYKTQAQHMDELFAFGDPTPDRGVIWRHLKETVCFA